jgi:hypothetical protein
MNRFLLLTSIAVLLLSACSRDGGETEAAKRDAETTPVIRDVASSGSGRPAPPLEFIGQAAPPVSSGGVVLRVLAEGEVSTEGQLTLPAMERDMVYLMARVETEAGAPIPDATIEVTSRAGNQILLDEDTTDEYGYAAFTIYAARSGKDTLTLSAAGVSTDFLLDVMTLDQSPWLEGLQGDGITAWSRLRDANLRFEETQVVADFGDEIAEMEGKSIKLAGYMMPMSADMQQTTFLLSASPPNCFFHVPGGPTTIAMVETGASGVMMTMEPLVIEGKLELVRRSEQGILYRLIEARSANTP